jgi:hypothetical protein
VEGVIARRVMAVALGVVMAGSVVACSSSGDEAGTTTTSATAAREPSAWVKAWKPKLVSDYAPAQEAFLTAIQTARVADVQAAALKVKAANETLALAIQAAGDPPPADDPALTELLLGLSSESAVISEILTRCTGEDPTCQKFVTRYARNNRDTIVPALDVLGADQ